MKSFYKTYGKGTASSGGAIARLKKITANDGEQSGKLFELQEEAPAQPYY
ncbi:hypothetical protein MKZ25_00110 [Solibacillus sp. FSL W7-1464]